MKRILSMLLVFAMALPLCGCGKSKAAANVEKLISAIGEVTLESGDAIASAQSAYDALTDQEKAEVENYNQLVEAKKRAEYVYGKDAYDHLCKALEIANKMNDDLYCAWEIVVRDEKALKRRGIEYFIANKCMLSEDDLVEGFAMTTYQVDKHQYLYGDDETIEEEWTQLEEADRERYREMVRDVSVFSMATPLVRFSVNGMIRSYVHNKATLDDAKTNLDSARTTLKVFTADYADYEHYPKLKGLYTSVNSFLELSTSPNQSFEQYKVTLNNYRKEIRDFQNDLDFIFND